MTPSATDDRPLAPKHGLMSLLFGVAGVPGLALLALLAIGFGRGAHREYLRAPEEYRYDLGLWAVRLGTFGFAMFVLGAVGLFVRESM